MEKLLKFEKCKGKASKWVAVGNIPPLLKFCLDLKTIRLPTRHSPRAWHKIQSSKQRKLRESESTFPFTQSFSVNPSPSFLPFPSPSPSLPHHHLLMYDWEFLKTFWKSRKKQFALNSLTFITPTYFIIIYEYSLLEVM